MSAKEITTLETRKTMKVCSRHGKKRQLIYLVEGENEGEWLCRDEDQCKMSLVGVKTKARSESEMTDQDRPFSPPFGLDHSQSISDLNYPSVTSWADEVEQEFPEGLLSFEDCRPMSFPEPGSQQKQQRWQSYPLMQSYPQPLRRAPTLPMKSKRIQPYQQDPELLLKIEQLQDEVANTKRELKKAREEVKAVLKNERLLESIIQELRTEVAEIHKRQLQDNDERLRKPVAKLNPEATPFVPVARCSVLQSKTEQPRKEDPFRCVDSARSSNATAQTALTSLEVESYDSENFGIAQEDGTDFDSDHDDEDRQPSPRGHRLPRARSQETFDRAAPGLLGH